MNLDKSSNAPLYDFRSNFNPHRSQNFFGVGFLGIGITCYPFFDFAHERTPAMHHSTGNPISHPLKNGFNRASFWNPALLPVTAEDSPACSPRLPVHCSIRSAFRFACCPGGSFVSFAFGVCHPASSIFASVARLVWSIRPVFRLCHLFPTRSRSSLISPALPSADGVGHPAMCTSFRNLHWQVRLWSTYCIHASDDPSRDASSTLIVCHPVQSLSDVRRADAVCAQYRRPAGVAFSFQVSLYSIEPPLPNRSFNLLTKDCVRAALADEIEEDGPEMTGVGLCETFPRA
jgi:hypothetical protein